MGKYIIKDHHRYDLDYMVCYGVSIFSFSFLLINLYYKFYEPWHENTEVSCLILCTMLLFCFSWYWLYIRKARKKTEFIVLKIDEQGVYFNCKYTYETSLDWSEIKKIELGEYNGHREYICFFTYNEMVYYFCIAGYLKDITFNGVKKACQRYSNNKDLKILIVEQEDPFYLPKIPVPEEYYQWEKNRRTKDGRLKKGNDDVDDRKKAHEKLIETYKNNKHVQIPFMK